MGGKESNLLFFPIINLVILSSFIFSLLNMVAVAVDDDLDFAVEADDAFVGTLLPFEGMVGNGERVVDGDVVLRLVVALEVVEALDNLRLFDDLVGELFHIEGVLLLEELQRPVQQVDLVGLGDLELFRQRLGDEVLGHRHHVLGVRILVLPLPHMQEIVNPVLCLYSAVGVIDHRHHIAVLALAVEDQAALVELLDVDALLALEVEVNALVQHLQERVLVLRLEQPDGVHRLVVHDAVAEIDRIELSALDFGVGALVVEVFGEVDGLLEQCLGVVEDLRRRPIDHVVFDAAVVVEFEEFLGGEGGEEIIH